MDTEIGRPAEIPPSTDKLWPLTNPDASFHLKGG